jgi:hypothetical protein
MATRSLGTLTIDLIAKIAGFVQGMDRAAREADKRFKEIEKRAKMAGAAIGTALVAGAGLVANQLRNTINQMDELSKAAQRASMPTEEFSKLAYAGNLADVSIQDLQASMGRLAKAQGDAQRETSVQARVFEALGIATKDAEGNLRSTHDVLLDFADSFKELKGSPEIMAAGMNIFGRSFQNLIPLLKDGSQGLKDAGIEAEQLGLVLSTEAGQQAEEFNDNITRLQSALTGMWLEVAQQVLPNLLELTNKFVEGAKEGDTMRKVADDLATALRGVADTASLFTKLIDALGRVRSMLVEIERVGAKLHFASWTGIGERVRAALPEWLYTPIGSGKVAGATPSVSAPVAAPVAEFDPTLGAPLTPAERAKIEADRLKAEAARLKALRDALGGGGGNKPGGGGRKSEAELEAERVQRAYESLMATMRERIALFNAEGEAAKVAYELEHGALKALDDAKKQELLTEAQRYDALVKRREADEAAYRLAQEETRRIQEGLKYGKQVVSDLQFELELMRMTNAERATAIQLRGMEAEAVAEYGDAIRELNRVIEQEMENARFLDGVRSEFSGFITDVVTGTESIKDAFKSMLDNIAAMITQRIAENWVEKLFGGFGTSQTGSGGGWISTIAGLFAGGRATGGWIGAGKFAEVNERGIEMATVRGRDYLLTGGSPVEITPNHRMGMGRPVSVTQQFINPVLADRRSDSQRAAEAARRQREALRNA